MKTSILMGLSAGVLALLGLAGTFLPQELLALTEAPAAGASALLVQAAGALYLGFALLNWLTRASPMGGIYGRPVALANFLHFTTMTFALWRAVAADEPAAWLLGGAIVYTLFAVAFGRVLFGRSPALERV